MGQGKIPRWSNRLMHRKRVTCELHDSYFSLITIKYAIPGTAEVTHSDGQLWGDIEWAIELLYNSVKIESLLVWRSESFWRPVSFGDQTSWWQDVVEKASTQQWAGPPVLRLSNPGEQERHNADGHKSGGQYVAILFGLQLPFTHNPFK